MLIQYITKVKLMLNCFL